ncbi:MAG TPA: nuclear transport factor 2 family protein [Phenylobacterium sp.]|nr:nuclear transport factor 2 family protein [Phenylobacterium sp.]
MTTAEDAIRARRRLTNKLIAAHDAARLKPFLDPAINLIAGDGSLLTGAASVIAAFDAQFRDPAFVTYVRTTEAVRLDAQGARAAETGAWTALWRAQGGETAMSGTYLACWRKSVGQWVIESELFITLAEAG